MLPWVLRLPACIIICIAIIINLCVCAVGDVAYVEMIEGNDGKPKGMA